MNSAYRLITDSAVFAAQKHAGQMRKELNEPYINHPLRCGAIAAQLGYSSSVIAALHLHDVIEDTPTTLEELRSFCPDETIELVDALTKRFGASKDYTPEELKMHKACYYNGIEQTPGAIAAKTIDRIDNLRDMMRTAHRSPTMFRWATTYFAKTLEEVSPLVRKLNVTDIKVADLYEQTVAQMAAVLAKRLS